MQRIIRFFVKINLTVALVFFSNVALPELSQNAPKGKVRIDLISTPDWIEVAHVEKIPEKLVIRLAHQDRESVLIATFNQDGPAFPELVSIFKEKIDGNQTLFAIIKWRYYLPGVDAEGNYYEVHAYNFSVDKVQKIIFSENKEISDFFGSGFDGKLDGKIVHFRFKDASSIRRSLIKNRKR